MKKGQFILIMSIVIYDNSSSFVFLRFLEIIEIYRFLIALRV